MSAALRKGRPCAIAVCLYEMKTIATVVAVTVMVCMTAAFAVLFALHARVRGRAVRGGYDDAPLARLLNNLTVKFRKRHPDATPTLVLQLDGKSNKAVKITGNILFIAFFLVIAAATTFAAAGRAGGGTVYLGDTAYLTVQSGSMASKNSQNAAAQSYDNALELYALIGVTKTSAKDISVGDILAFNARLTVTSSTLTDYDKDIIKNADGTYTVTRVIMHRVVSVSCEDGAYLFTTMGDANSSSASYEKDIPESSLIGVYNGFQSVALGAFFIYMQSNIGLVSLAFAIVFLLCAGISEGYIDKCEEERLRFIAAESERDWYGEIKKRLLAFAGVRARRAESGEDAKGRAVIAVLKREANGVLFCPSLKKQCYEKLSAFGKAELGAKQVTAMRVDSAAALEKAEIAMGALAEKFGLSRLENAPEGGADSAAPAAAEEGAKEELEVFETETGGAPSYEGTSKIIYHTVNIVYRPAIAGYKNGENVPAEEEGGTDK